MDFQQRTSILQNHFGGDGFNSSDFVHAFGQASQAFLYSCLFVPEFVEVHGSVLLESKVSTEHARLRFIELVESNEMKPEEFQGLEASFNMVEVGYLFDAPGRDTTDDEDYVLAELIAESWKNSLKARFPCRRFTVEVLSSETTGSTVGVHFYEDRI